MPRAPYRLRITRCAFHSIFASITLKYVCSHVCSRFVLQVASHTNRRRRRSSPNSPAVIGPLSHRSPLSISKALPHRDRGLSSPRPWNSGRQVNISNVKDAYYNYLVAFDSLLIQNKTVAKKRRIAFRPIRHVYAAAFSNKTPQCFLNTPEDGDKYRDKPYGRPAHYRFLNSHGIRLPKKPLTRSQKASCPARLSSSELHCTLRGCCGGWGCHPAFAIVPRR
jgi:hypothetical protein